MTNTKKIPDKILLLITALRSGDYQQSRGQLQDDLGYCCLGVACKVAESQGVEVALDSLGRLEGGSLLDHYSVLQWFGFKSFNGMFIDKKGNKLIDLAYLNDCQKLTFDQIADFIEKNCELLVNNC